MKDYELNSNKVFTTQVRAEGIASWINLIQLVKRLPYGRNAQRDNLLLVLDEKKGSCSSKHAYLKQIAIENDIQGVNLILGIYKMTEYNTLGIAPVLSKAQIDYIPEAHCYLKIDGVRCDFTQSHSAFELIQNDLLHEETINPEQIIQYKVDKHKLFLKDWLKSQKMHLSFEELWALREACISQLSEANE